jgi:KDO2-lipid IV(A) lauroyltransferase
MLQLLYYILYAFVWLIAWLPLSILYLLSDIAYVFVFFVFAIEEKLFEKT